MDVDYYDTQLSEAEIIRLKEQERKKKEQDERDIREKWAKARRCRY